MSTWTRVIAALTLAGLVSGCLRTPAPPPVARATTVAAATPQVALAAKPAGASTSTSAASLTAQHTPPTPLPPAPDPAYWPTDDWRTSTPEEQGMDSYVLAEMIETIAKQHLDVHGILIVRHGYVVAEACFHPYIGDIPHELQSVTKSFTGALVGVAIGEGKIKGPAEKVLSFFPDRQVANPDPHKDAMTLRDLLSMRSGLAWREWQLSITSPDNDGRAMTNTRDWVGYVLDRPMAGAPGGIWNYNSGAAHLLSAIVQRATGGTAEQYARSHLFGPLGIVNYAWPADPQGVTTGYGGLRLRPREMAKFGYLYLHGGRWDGRQVVPSDWVRASLEWPEAGGAAYGYDMWLEAGGRFAATGRGGQMIWVDPADDLVSIIVAGLPESQAGIPQYLMSSYVRRAVKSDRPLPAEPTGQARLLAAERAAATPEPQPVTHGSPDIARAAARYCGWSANHQGVVGGSTTFGDGPEATSNICFAQGCVDFTVGLDGAYRVSDWGELRMAMRGGWENDRVFVLQAQILGQTGRQELRFVPARDGTTQITLLDSLTGEIQHITCTPK